MHFKKDKNYLGSNGKSEEENNYNNGFKKLYIKIQNEIKNIVITKLHNQVGKLLKELENLKKENTIIKNDLVYILKRILNNKSEYNLISPSLNNFQNNSSNNLISNFNSSTINANNSTINLNKSKNSFMTIDRYNNYKRNNYNTSRSKISIRANYNIDNFLNSDNNGKFESSAYHLDKNKYKNIDNKIDSYLNSLYKHNFFDSHIGSENNYNLNKNKGIYDELFSTQNSLIDNNYINHNSPKNIRNSANEKNERGKSNSVKGNDISNKKNKNLSVRLGKKYNFFKKNMDKHKKDINKKQDYDLNNSFSIGKKNKSNRYFINSNRNIKNINQSVGKTHAKKSNSRINLIYSNRSPFLVNKF